MALNLGELVAFLDLDTGKYDDAVGRMPSKLSGATAAFGAAGLVIGGVIAAAMTKGLTDAISFEDSLATVSGQLSLTEAESARVGAAAGRVYAQNYGESVEQVQSVVGGVITQIQGMGDASDSVVDGMTAKVLNYASAFGFETSEAISMVQQLLSSGLATSADEAMDLMTASMQRVPESLRGDMADAITEYGPLLADLGFTGVEAFDLLASGADRGMYGIDKAGDAVKEFGIRATDMSAASKGAYDALGMSQEDMTNRLLAGGDTAKQAFNEIVTGLQGIADPAAQSQAALALFGTPLEDLGTSNIPSFLGSLTDLGGGMADAAGAAEAMGEKMGSSTASQMEAMNRQVQIMMSDLMSGLLPVLTAVFGFLADNPAVLQAVAFAVGVLAVSFLAASAAIWVMNSALFANPITWIILGIVALIAALVLLIANWDAVVAWITEVWGGFMGWLGEVIDGFVSWWNEVWAAVGAWITSVWEGFIGFVTDVFNNFMLGLRIIGDAIASWWNGLWAGIGAWISSVWTGFVGFVNGVVQGFVAFIMGAFNAYVSFWAGLWNGVRDTIVNVWNGIISWFQGIPGAIMAVFSGAASWLYNIGRDIINGLWNGLKSIAGSITSWFENTFGGIIDTVRNIFGIASPSKVFRQIAVYVGEGFISGIRLMQAASTAVVEKYGRSTVEGYMRGIARVQPDLDRRMGELVDVAGISATAHVVAGGAEAPAAAPAAASTTVNYYAAENRSLSAEEDLFAALGSPRVTLGRND